LGLTVYFVSQATVDLENYPPVSADEVTIMAISHNLATRGIFGIDAYAGFFNADQHWLLNPPAHFVSQAIAFQIAGTGVAQARWVSLLAGVSIIWMTSGLAFRWYGLGAALLASVLLVFWRSDLIGLDPGLPLLGVSRSGRYDVGAVAWSWASIALLDRALRRPAGVSALALGVCAGVATLTQFFGAFVLPLIAGVWLWQRGRRARVDSTSCWIAMGVALVVLPYTLYVARHLPDLAGQAARVDTSGRLQLGRAEFYRDNLVNEPSRFENRSQPSPGAAWLLTVGVWPALAYLTYRAWRVRASGDRILWASLCVFEGLLALFDRSKAPVYAIVLLPALCIMLAASWSAGLRWVWKRPRLLRLTAVTLTIGLGLILVREGISAYRTDQQRAQDVSRYLDVGRKIDAYLSSGARVLGSDRWGWVLHDHPFLSAGSLLSQWQNVGLQYRSPIEFANQVAATGIDFFIVNNNVRGELTLFDPALQTQFWSFLATRSLKVADWQDTTYGRIEIYQLKQTP
jgi:4-amino-4-deoxy-L-arabinose transferase-like glycosyltransferase